MRADRRRVGLPSQRWWIAVAIVLAIVLALPGLVSQFALLQISVIAILSLLGLSEGFLWGFAGILSFGQTAFFGLGGYVYALAALNLNRTDLPLLGAILLPAILAALVGYFMIYGRIGDVYLS